MRASINHKQLAEVRKLLEEFPRSIDRVITQSINRALIGVQGDAVRVVRDKVNLTAKRIKKDSKIFRASSQQMTGRVEFRGGKIGLFNYGARASTRGVSFRIWRGGPLQRFRHAFIGTTANKKGDEVFRHVFEREYRGKKTKKKDRKVRRWLDLPKKYRYPIRRLEGPSIPALIEREDIEREIQYDAEKRLAAALDQRLKFEIKRLKGE